MEIAESNKAMWKGALFPSLILSALSILVSTVLLGSSGFFGSLLASFTVVIFFSVSLLVSRLTKSADPISTMALAMFSYFTKLLLIAGFLIAVTRLTDEGDVDHGIWDQRAHCGRWLASRRGPLFLSSTATVTLAEAGNESSGIVRLIVPKPQP